MNAFEFLNLEEYLSVYDDSMEINKRELESVFNLVKNKPIAQKLKIAQGGIQSSIQHFKEITRELTDLYNDLSLKLPQISTNYKELDDRIQHLPKYQKHQMAFQEFKKIFSADAYAFQLALKDLMTHYIDVNFLLVPMEYTSEEHAIELVIKFNIHLNQKINHIAQLVENFQQIYKNLLKDQKELEKLMRLCHVQKFK